MVETFDKIKFISLDESKVDKTKKYIFELEDGNVMETTYIDNGSNKDIICVSCQTMCTLKCKFCHLTDLVGKIKVRNITAEEILEGVKHVNDDLGLESNNRPLLISYMGAGEPVLNVDNVVESIVLIKDYYPHSRSGLATIMPKNSMTEFFKLAERVRKYNIEMKLHLSLHFMDETVRKEWMPNALDINPAISALDFYQKYTKNPVEIHYTLIEGQNDTEDQINQLIGLMEGKDINVKFLHYKERTAAGEKACNENRAKELVNVFADEGLQAEFYNPPGEDVGSSCGQFLLERHAKK